MGYFVKQVGLSVIFEDNHLLAVYKPTGVLSQGDTTGDESMVTLAENYLRNSCQKQGNVYVALLHRLDRPTSGIMLLAKTSKAAARMSEQFRLGEIKKRYFAITTQIPRPESQELIHHLKKIPGKNITVAYNSPQKNTQEARMAYRVIQTLNGLALLDVQLFTGRQHQIRAQLARIACPIQGDGKYGKNTAFLPDLSISLSAYLLEFKHPITKQKVCLTAIPESVSFQPFKQSMESWVEQFQDK